MEDPDAGLQRHPGTGQIDEKRRVTNSILIRAVTDGPVSELGNTFVSKLGDTPVGKSPLGVSEKG